MKCNYDSTRVAELENRVHKLAAIIADLFVNTPSLAEHVQLMDRVDALEADLANTKDLLDLTCEIVDAYSGDAGDEVDITAGLKFAATLVKIAPAYPFPAPSWAVQRDCDRANYLFSEPFPCNGPTWDFVKQLEDAGPTPVIRFGDYIYVVESWNVFKNQMVMRVLGYLGQSKTICPITFMVSPDGDAPLIIS